MASINKDGRMTGKIRYQIGDKIAERYEVHHIRTGGMGAVYFCLDVIENVPLALKTFHPRYLENPQKLQKALREVEIWVTLAAHPNIVRCYFLDYFDNIPFIALEWIAEEPGMGVDLRAWIQRGALDLHIALDVTIDICRGLQHAQTVQPGFVHRDITPRNILIEQGRRAKITDFGLAAVYGINAVNSEKGAGTPPYIPPEQWEGLPLDERADIYAIGCTLYEMLTGEKAFRPDGDSAEHSGNAAVKALHFSPVRPALPDTFPPEVRALVSACLAVERANRPPSMAALLERLNAVYRNIFSVPPKILHASGEFSATDFNNRGVTYLHLNKPEAALKDFNRALELLPRDPHIRLNRARVCLDLWHIWQDARWVEAALADCAWALATDTTLGAAYAIRGTIYADTGDLAAALADFDHAVVCGADDAEMLFNRGVVQHNLQNYAAACTDFEHVLRRNPSDERTYAALALSLAAMGNGDMARQVAAQVLDASDSDVVEVLRQVQQMIGEINRED